MIRVAYYQLVDSKKSKCSNSTTTAETQTTVQLMAGTYVACVIYSRPVASFRGLAGVRVDTTKEQRECERVGSAPIAALR